MKKLLLITFLAAFLALGTASSDNRSLQSEEGNSSDQGGFPITVDFHCPRNFGFHIGDKIPLTVTMEAEGGPIVDLVNLPQKGETLRISYATEGDWNPVESEYHYRSLYSQAFDIFVSRTATYFGAMKDIKGPIEDGTTTLIWRVSTVVGGLMVLLTLITWPWEFIRKRWKVEGESPDPTPTDHALEALQEAREKCFNYEDHRKRLFFEINRILRTFLKDVCGLNTANRPSMEIVNQLKDHPFYEELKELVVRINQVIYEGDAPVDVESIMRQFDGLLRRIDGTTHPGMNHDKAG